MWDALIDLYLLLARLMLVLAKDCSSNTITHKMELTSGTLMYKIRKAVIHHPRLPAEKLLLKYSKQGLTSVLKWWQIRLCFYKLVAKGSDWFRYVKKANVCVY